MLGFFQSAFNPCAFSIIADYFPQNQRTTANSLLNSGMYFGGAMASLTTLIISTKGWRPAYEFVGLVGIAIGMMSLIVIREPERNRFDTKQR